MFNPVFVCKYQCCGKEYIVDNSGKSEFLDADIEITDSKIEITLKPKAFVKLLETSVHYEHKFDDDDRFFANGYQSWSIAREFKKTDKQKGVAKPFRVKGFLKDLVGISSDIWFVKQPTKPGRFSSHFYTYIKNLNNVSDILFLGSLDEKSGYTVYYADMVDGGFSVTKDVEGVSVGKEYKLYDIAILRGTFDEVFDEFTRLSGVKKPKIDHLCGYTSWYNYFQNINEDIILRDLNAMDIVKEEANIFQVDDGYETFVGDWLDPNPAKFPNGMKFIADEIHKKGYKAGLWLAPFNVQIKSRTCKEHPDWLIRGANGKPVLGCPGWGGALTLDIYNPEAREYIRHCLDVVLNEWGYDMVKLDFLYSQCMFPRNNKSRGQIMVEAMDFLRECCGDKLILGCGAPLGAAFGRVDACRVTCDVDPKYSKGVDNFPINTEIVSAKNSMNNTLFRRQLNGRAFINDPDVFFLRHSNIQFSGMQKILLGTINHICGDVLFVSDNMEEYDEKDIPAVKKFYSKSDLKVVDVNYVDDDKKMIVELVDSDGKKKMLWFNLKTAFGNQEAIIGLSAKR